MHLEAVLFIRSIAQVYGDSVEMERGFCGDSVERSVSKAQDDADIPTCHRADQRQDDDDDDGDEGHYQEESHSLCQLGRFCVAVVWLIRFWQSEFFRFREMVVRLYHHHSLAQACQDSVTPVRRLCGGCYTQNGHRVAFLNVWNLRVNKLASSCLYFPSASAIQSEIACLKSGNSS
jgi:hypothetical protein